ncbi:MAG TPA: GDSL-type esterase/lipase family protein [Solirubrobacteraceae bacterium]|nr:GDSL-type esterase/lipase family protein [Solirubrobacteraceae bacterium]
MADLRSAELAPLRALFFGDSLVAGVGDQSGAGWVGRVAAACAARGWAITSYNLGVRRETSVQVASRLRAEAVPRIPTGARARIVVSVGANDTTLERGRPRVAPGRSLEALAGMLDQARALGHDMLVVGPAPVRDDEQNARIETLCAEYRLLCSERGSPFIAVFDSMRNSAVWMKEVATDDGAHPGARGYELLARTLVGAGIVAWLVDGVLRDDSA